MSSLGELEQRLKRKIAKEQEATKKILSDESENLRRWLSEQQKDAHSITKDDFQRLSRESKKLIKQEYDSVIEENQRLSNEARELMKAEYQSMVNEAGSLTSLFQRRTLIWSLILMMIFMAGSVGALGMMQYLSDQVVSKSQEVKRLNRQLADLKGLGIEYMNLEGHFYLIFPKNYTHENTYRVKSEGKYKGLWASKFKNGG